MCVNLTMTINICSSFFGFILKAFCFEVCFRQPSLKGKNTRHLNLSRAFRFCCLFCISPLSYKLSIRLSSVKLSDWPDGFSPSKTSNIVHISMVLDGMIFSFLYHEEYNIRLLSQKMVSKLYYIIIESVSIIFRMSQF